MNTAPDRVDFPAFSPLVMEALQHAALSDPHAAAFSIPELISAAEKVCPTIRWDVYGERSSGPSGGKCNAGKWMFTFTLNKLAKGGIIIKVKEGMYRPQTVTSIGTSHPEVLPTNESAGLANLQTDNLDDVLDDFMATAETDAEITIPPENASNLDLPQRADSALTVTNRGVSWLPTDIHFPMGEPFGGDVYLSRVAAEQTPCFGGWSAKASPCKGCALANRCFNVAVTALAGIGKALDDKDAGKVAPPPPPEPKNIPGSKIISLPLETVCSTCNKPIKGGVKARSVPGKGMFHLECEV